MSKVVKKTTYKVEDKYGNTVTVYARIEKESGLYYWYTSHLTKLQDIDSLSLYFPACTASSMWEAEIWLDAYINTMKESKVVEPNKHYNI